MSTAKTKPTITPAQRAALENTLPSQEEADFLAQASAEADADAAPAEKPNLFADLVPPAPDTDAEAQWDEEFSDELKDTDQKTLPIPAPGLVIIPVGAHSKKWINYYRDLGYKFCVPRKDKPYILNQERFDLIPVANVRVQGTAINEELLVLGEVGSVFMCHKASVVHRLHMRPVEEFNARYKVKGVKETEQSVKSMLPPIE